MATPRYNALRDKVREWSNRDIEVLSDEVIRDCIQFAADKAYKVLEVPPLEKTYTYEVDLSVSGQVIVGDDSTYPDYQHWVNHNYIPVPTDLIKFIYVKKLSGYGVANRDGVVFENKIDTRSYADPRFIVAQPYYFAVQDFKIRIPEEFAVQDGDVFEVHYYGRLPAMDAEYAVSEENEALGIYSFPIINGNIDMEWTGSLEEAPVDENGDPVYSTYYDDYTDLVAAIEAGTEKSRFARDGIYGGSEGDIFTEDDLVKWWDAYGIEIPNWVRDENEKIVLYGALAEIGQYLADQEMFQRFNEQFMLEIKMLNGEEQYRVVSGGNTSVNYPGYGLI